MKKISNYKLDYWIYDEKKSIDIDTRKCHNKTLYEGNSKSSFLTNVKNNYNKYNNNLTNLNNIKYNQNLFEIFKNPNSECKLFFDIDKVKININELNPVLSELFDFIDKICEKKLNRKKYLVFYKKLVDKDFNELHYTHSLRIINFEYKINYFDAINLINLLKELSKNELINGLDDSVYHHNRNMCLPYNSKPYSLKYNDIFYNKKFTPEESVNHFFIYYDYNCINLNINNLIKEYLISCTEDCILLKINKEPIKKIDLLKTNDFLNRKSIYLEQNKYNIIETIIKYTNKNKDFYSKKYSVYWCKFVYYFKCLDIEESEIYDFLEYSAEVNKSYNYESNIEYFDKRLSPIDSSKDYNYVYKVIAENLNLLQDEYYFYINKKEEQFKLLAEWIVKKTNLNYDFVSKIIAKYKPTDFKKLEIIKINDDLFYNFKTGNLHIKNNKYCKNYFIEEHIENYKNNNYDNYDLVIDDIKDEKLLKVLKKFKRGKIENLAIEMDWGGGKSRIIEKPIIEHFCNTASNYCLNQILDKKIKQEPIHLNKLNNVRRIIAFSPNNSLNKKEFSELKEINNNCFVNHIIIKELSDKLNKLNIKLENCDDGNQDEIRAKIIELNNEKKIYVNKANIMTSLESANRINTSDKSNDISLVVNDEFNSLFSKFNSTMETFQHIDHEVAFNKFIEINKKAKQRLILDADIENHKLDLYCKVCKIKNIYKVRINGNIFNNFKIAEDGKIDKYKILYCENRKHLTEEIIKNIDKKIVISTTSSTHGYYIFKLLISNMYDKNLNLIDGFKDDIVGYIFGDGLYIFNCRFPEKSIIDNKIDKLNSDNFNIDNDKECLYKSILDKYHVKKKNTIEIKNSKNDFLDRCEEQIIKKYQITKYIRSPTISVGISINERYFDKQFNFVLNGSVGCLEALQMWFRERRTFDREIFFCLGTYFKNYNKCLNNSCNIEKRYKNNYRIANLDLKKLLEKKNIVNQIQNDFYDWSLINEIDNENYILNFSQIFLELLYKHSFIYNENIFILNSKYELFDFLDETKDDFKSVELYNLLNTDISNLNESDYELLKNKKEDNVITNKEYLEYRKFKLFNYHLFYNEYYINKFCRGERECWISKLEDKIKTYEDFEAEEYLIDVKRLKILKNNELWENILNYNNYLIKKYIETESHYKKYKLYEYKSDYKTKYFRCRNLIYYNSEEYTDDYDDNKEKFTNEYIATNKLIYWLLKFLDIDILRDFKKEILKHYIIDNKKHKYLISFKELLNSEIKNNQSSPYKFIDFVNEELLVDYNNNSILKHYKPINIKKLEVKNHLREIITILKFYLSKVNLYIDYGYNINHQTKLFNSLQFTIRKEHNITTKNYFVPTNILFNKKLNDEKIEIYEKQINLKYHNGLNIVINNKFNENKKQFINKSNIKNNPTRTNTITLKTENIYIEKNITNKEILPITKTIYKNVEEEEVIEDIYNNKIIIRPIKNIKRKNIDRNYYDNNEKLKSELYSSYNVDTKKEIINYFEGVKPNIINFANLINLKIKVNKIKDVNNIDNKKCTKRRYRIEEYDINKREMILNFINNEIKRPVKDKFKNVMNELLLDRIAPVLIKKKSDLIKDLVENLIEFN